MEELIKSLCDARIVKSCRTVEARIGDVHQIVGILHILSCDRHRQSRDFVGNNLSQYIEAADEGSALKQFYETDEATEDIVGLEPLNNLRSLESYGVDAISSHLVSRAAIVPHFQILTR